MNRIFKVMGYASLFVLFLGLIQVTSAQLIERDYCVDAFVTDISPTSVGIDEDFTVGILIDNCGKDISDNVTFQLTDTGPYISVKEPLIKEIGRMGYSNSDRFLLYHMRTAKDATPGEYSIKYKLVYGGTDFTEEKDGRFSITVTGEDAELNIASVRTKPTLPKEGETVELTVRIENFGDGTANSLRVEANHPFKGEKEAFIGTLDPDEDGPAVFTFIASQPGEFSIPIKIYFKDDFGDHQLETNVGFIVLELEKSYETEISFAALFALFALVIIYLVRKTRKKETVIRQILHGQKVNDERKSHKTHKD